MGIWSINGLPAPPPLVMLKLGGSSLPTTHLGFRMSSDAGRCARVIPSHRGLLALKGQGDSLGSFLWPYTAPSLPFWGHQVNQQCHPRPGHLLDQCLSQAASLVWGRGAVGGWRGARTRALVDRTEVRESGYPGRMRTSGRGRSAHAGRGGASVGHVLRPVEGRRRQSRSFPPGSGHRSHERTGHAAFCRHTQQLSGLPPSRDKTNAFLRTQDL